MDSPEPSEEGPDEVSDGQDWISRELHGVVDEIRAALDDRKSILIPHPDRFPDALALAGLAHCCILLEELDDLRVMGNDFVAYLVARGCVETWLTASWLFLTGEEGQTLLEGSYARALRIQNRKILDSIEQVKRNRKEILRSRRKVERANEGIRLGNERNGTNKPLLTMPDLPPEAGNLASGLEAHLRQVKDVAEAKVSYETMADQLGPLALQAGIGGGNWSDLYNVVYRSLSTWGAHPSIWVLNAYLDEDKPHMLHVRPMVPAEGRADTATFDTIQLVVMLAAEVFKKLGIDDAHMRQVDQLWRELRAYMRTHRKDADEGSVG
jgi:hypothetical protein